MTAGGPRFHLAARPLRPRHNYVGLIETDDTKYVRPISMRTEAGGLEGFCHGGPWLRAPHKHRLLVDGSTAGLG
jgi:hypothetical protein